MSENCIAQDKLNELFPLSLSDQFFEAIYGDVDEGAYDIVLVCREIQDNEATLAFELRKRLGKCLKCSLTYGLPEVFSRHPLLKIGTLAEAIAKELKWPNGCHWKLLPVREYSEDLHEIPFVLYKN